MPCLNPQRYEISKKCFSIIIVFIMALVVTSCGNTVSDDMTVEGDDSQLKRDTNGDLIINFGRQHSTTGFQYYHIFQSKNGKWVTFWAKNTGKVDLKISMNDFSKELILKPNEEGSLTEEVVKNEEAFSFKAGSPSGGDTSLDFRITQGEENNKMDMQKSD